MTLFGQSASALLALCAALFWGGGDFAGGMGAKQAGGTLRGALRVVLLSHAASFIALLAVALVRRDPVPHAVPMLWSLAAGLLGGSSVCLFYVALSRGAMGASAAVSGLLAAAIPACVSIVLDGAPGRLRVVGFALAGAAIWLIAAGPKEEDGEGASGTLWMAIVSGAGFGLYFVSLKFAGAGGVVWPVAIARVASLSLCSAAVLLLRLRGPGLAQGFPVERRGRVPGWAVGTAILDTGGNMFFLAATRAGRLDVASVLASLYPATTILLAAWALHEAPTRRQGLGMAVALAAVVLITL